MTHILFSCFLFFCTSIAIAQNGLEFDGQLLFQGNANFNEPSTFFNAGRYLPELTFRTEIDSDQSFTLQTAANFSFSKFFNKNQSSTLTGSLNPYRAWARYINKQWEFRLGLQKIDFGSATLLRPLQWFNQIDPRDPLALTNGVYGLLMRYYFKNNTNIWLWGLYGNDKTRGFDALPTFKRKPEFGGRFQTTVPKGELAISYHYRTAAADENKWINPFTENPEYRIGLDAKWDLGVGLWLESSYIKRNRNIGVFTEQYLLTVGIDYTFAIGSGLNLVGEHLVSGYGQNDPFQEKPTHFSALSGSYPISFFNSLNVLYYHQWRTHQNTFLINYQHQFTGINAYLIAYYNPESLQGIQQNDILNTFSGPGVQLLFVYNH